MEKVVLKQILDEYKTKIDSLKNVVLIDSLNAKIKELEEKTLSSSFWQNQDSAKTTINELNILKDRRDSYISLNNHLESLSLIYELSNDDESFLNQADTEYETLIKEYKDFEVSLLLNEEFDSSNAILEIHSGAGGTESLDWSNMLFRMYSMYLNKNKYKVEILDYQAGDEVGIKSVSMRVSGKFSYGYLKGETGVHRLVRLSPFDSDHARHTTFASVQVTPVIEKDIDIKINDEDLKIDVYHSSGAGGQSVNTTDSAVRITHLPSKIVVTCQNERSQIQNKETALKILKSKLYQLELMKRKESLDKLSNKQEISFGSQIRSYVFHPYSLIKDLRTQYETSQVEKVMNGDLDEFINEYLRYRGSNNE